MTVQNRRAIAGVATLFMLFVPAQSASLAAESAVLPERQLLTTDEENALAFRRMFGLDADPSLISNAAVSPEYSAANYGVPLSPAEEAELGRRVEVEQASHGAAAFGREQSIWGGYYFDQLARGAPVFLFTAEIEAMRSHIEKLLPEGTGFRVEQVTLPLSELVSTKEAVVEAYGDLRAAGIQITSTGLDLASNQVVVGIDGLTEEAARTISERFGPYVRVEDSPPAQADACPTSGCRPIKGGIRITGTPTGLYCTAGFVARRYGPSTALAVITAGHCIWVQAVSSYNTTWYHKTPAGTNQTFGTSRYHTFSQSSDGDVGLIELDADEYPATANRIYTNTSGGTVHTVTGVVYDIDQTQGSQACAYGAVSNAAFCTVINDADQTKQSCADPPWGPNVCHDIDHTKMYGYNLIPGDSGGPIYQIASYLNNTVYALGTHVHSIEGNTVPVVASNSGWYTPYFYGHITYNAVTPGTDGYNICTTAAC
jgi:hypothetical protein